MNSVQDKYERRSQKSATLDRHASLALRLIEAAEAAIAAHGLAELRARDLAQAAGCSVGAIYGVFPTLDALILAVNDRTVSALQDAMPAAPGRDPAELLAGFAEAYLAFAATHRHRWAALFKHRMPPGLEGSPDYQARQNDVFASIGAPLAVLRPGLSKDELTLLARTLFSAVHGIVQLGLEEKLASVPLDVLSAQLRAMVHAIAAGLARQACGK